ncbi:hypothetical protein [Streptomyces peucetius]|uniref:Uncharacterized protein n=1 Tax=Streptomyces peucetius TaxID=1950 RepID=A0ABY6IDI3_STRPE|nr:hypothetical protein [Streptomyces peucetius]UYQ63997.1 hypothetical protein OGH68_22705 [Streptomyces peucetius]
MEIVPLAGMAGAGFGEPRASVRGERGAPDSAFRRGAEPLTDMYADESCVFLEYDDADSLHAIEIASPGPVTLYGIRLLGRPEGEVVAELREAGHEVVAETEAGSTGWSLPALGVTLGGTAQDTDGFESVRLCGVATGRHAFEFFEASEEPAYPLDGLTVVPHQAVGPLRLGAGRGEMRRLLGPGIGSVPEFGAVSQDTFFCGVVLSYDAAGSVVRIALTGRTSVGYAGVQLLGRPRGDVRAEATGQRLRVVDREAELAFPDAGFSVLTARDEDGLPTSAVVLATSTSTSTSTSTPAPMAAGRR